MMPDVPVRVAIFGHVVRPTEDETLSTSGFLNSYADFLRAPPHSPPSQTFVVRKRVMNLQAIWLCAWEVCRCGT